ncbi:hypothetical protein GX48_04128 [Paracoccidioides brasiliensis]|nr:hypothetical protein GX48_04128 [Paracoccidioides brasiliensis]
MSWRLQSDYQHPIWGRTVEDQNDIVWTVVSRLNQPASQPPNKWHDTISSVPSAKITPIISPSSTPIPLHTTLTPSLPISQLPTTPTVELAILPFPSALPLDKKRSHKPLVSKHTLEYATYGAHSNRRRQQAMTTRKKKRDTSLNSSKRDSDRRYLPVERQQQP